METDFYIGYADAVAVDDVRGTAYRFGVSCERQEEASEEYTDAH